LSVVQTWQKRYLVLRDTWTEDGDTLLELHSSEALADSAGDTERCSTGGSGLYVINLRGVTGVDVFKESRSFAHAFIVFRLVCAGGGPVGNP
jgi:hypothetical protein